MTADAQYNEMKEKMHLTKKLYQSRHYAQCAKLGERLLADVKSEIHPIHLAHLHFYTALSHDTLAREATLKFRHVELNLAEEHYTAAIVALTHAKVTQPRDMFRSASAASTSSNEDIRWHRRRGSSDSSTSSNSSATSYEQDDHTSDAETKPAPTHLARPIPQAAREGGLKMLKRPIPSVKPLQTRSQTPLEYQLADDTAFFVRMIEHHLEAVRQEKGKAGAPTKRFSTTPTPTNFRASYQFNEKEADIIRENRRKLKFRPRFDPTSIQNLCNDALADLD